MNSRPSEDTAAQWKGPHETCRCTGWAAWFGGAGIYGKSDNAVKGSTAQEMQVQAPKRQLHDMQSYKCVAGVHLHLHLHSSRGRQAQTLRHANLTCTTRCPVRSPRTCSGTSCGRLSMCSLPHMNSAPVSVTAAVQSSPQATATTHWPSRPWCTRCGCGWSCSQGGCKEQRLQQQQAAEEASATSSITSHRAEEPNQKPEGWCHAQICTGSAAT